MKGNALSLVSNTDRIVSIDMLRGIAVLGILIMNIQHFSMPAAAYINPTAFGDLRGMNLWIWILSHMLASGKFLSIFSMLFGAGILLFTGRAELKGFSSAELHYRRMGWLLLFGMMHSYLLWSGDILVSYSLCGMLVFLFRNKAASTLLYLAFAFFLVPMLLDLFFVWSLPYWPPEVLRSTMDKWSPGTEVLNHHLEVYRSAWLKQMELRVPGSIFMQTGYFLMRPFWRITGLMLLGMSLFKWEVLTRGRSSGFYKKMIIYGLLTGYLLTGLGVYLNFRKHWAMEFSMFPGAQFNYMGSVAVALGYVGVVMLFSKSGGFRKIKEAISAVGRMAFSNYILMTLICTLLFYGYGLGLYGSVERKYQILIVLAIWSLVLIISPLWLKYFRFGPLELIWRRLTYRSR
ncbi:MAG: DUF418 domain-containing protein [Bacteroidales bacterium]|nr:DUF418 domain-containing protein [Bacteroidales bacterium]